MKPQASIVVVSFNTSEITVKCLDSIYRHSGKRKIEIIVVDNASSDGSPEEIKKKFPKVILIRNKKNIGFGAANNQGAKIASGKYLVFINSDIVLTRNSIEELVTWEESRTNAALVGCKLLNPDSSLQYSLGFLPSLGRIAAWMLFFDDLPIINRYFRAYHLEHPSWYKMDREIGWVTGAFFLVPKEIYNQIGGFDEKMFMYGEEVELQYRLGKAGLAIYYTPVTSVVHLGGASSQKVASTFSRTSEFKGLLYIFRKHFPRWQYPIIKYLVKLGILLRFVLFGVLMGNKNSRTTYAHAFREI